MAGDEQVQLISSLQLFLDGNEAAGEVLLALAGTDHHQRAFLECSALFETLELNLSHENMRIVEITCGILANLALFSDAFEKMVREISVVVLLINVCCSNDDPNVLAETLRGFTNITYTGNDSLICEHYELLAKFSMFVCENSLSGRLQSQLMQFVYYLHIYGQNLGAWYQYWIAVEFFRVLLLADNASDGANLPNTDLLGVLKANNLGDSTGLEWLLLCLDAVTLQTDYTTTITLLRCNWFIEVMLTLLLSNESMGWNSRASAVALSMAPCELFLVLSIIENIVSHRTSIQNPSEQTELIHHVDCLFSRSYSHPAAGDTPPTVAGLERLLRCMLEVLEDAVLMRDAHALRSIVYLVCALYAPLDHSEVSQEGEEGAPTVVETVGAAPRVACTHAFVCAARSMAEVMSLSGNATWANSACNGEFSLRDMLVCVHAVLTTEGNSARVDADADATRERNIARDAVAALLAKVEPAERSSTMVVTLLDDLI